MNPLVIIPVYNEMDILPQVVDHLHEQGCEVHVLNNWSTDIQNSSDIKADSIEVWPSEPPSFYNWSGILRRVEIIAFEKGQDRWVMLCDADEIRRSCKEFGNMSLSDSFSCVSLAGYNAVNFEVRNFVPTDNGWKPGLNPENYFRYCKKEYVDKGLPHIKAWFQSNIKVDLSSTGGHEAIFGGRKVYPNRFILKHYPIRSQQHGETKVLLERYPRYSKKERDNSWHVQYDSYIKQYIKGDKPSFVYDKYDLVEDKRNVSIITLTRYPELFNRLADSIDKHETHSSRKIVVTSCGAKIERDGWEVIEGVEPFVFSRNLNLGIYAAGSDDVLCVNDDVQFTSPLIESLSDVSYENKASIVSPQVLGDGIGNSIAKASHALSGRWQESIEYVPFVCVYIRRSILDVVGGLDESFVGYGGDDVDFCFRARPYGRFFIVNSKIKHGVGPLICSSSFSRTMKADEFSDSGREMLDKLKSKIETSDKHPESLKAVKSLLNL